MVIRNCKALTLALGLIGLSFATQCNSWASPQLGIAPVSGQLSSPFGWRTDPITGSQRFHGGVDIAAPTGMPVYALQPGYVMYSASYKGYGNVVVLNHGNGLYTLYGHNSRLLVSTGQTVAQGQAISLVGSTGRSTGPHLHFEVHYNGQYLNPLSYLSYFQSQTLKNSVWSRPTTVHQVSPAKSAVLTAKPHAAPVVRRTARHAHRKGAKVVELLSGSEVDTFEF